MATDAELLALAEQAVDPATGQPIPPQPGAGTGASLGLDLPVIPSGAPVEPITPNGPPVMGPVELPGDRALSLPPPVDAPFNPPASIPAPPAPSAPLSESGALGALGDARASAGDVATAQGQVGGAKAQESRLNADEQDKIAQQQRDNAVEIQIQQAAQEEGRARAQSVADKAAQQYKDFTFKDFWKDLEDSRKTSDGERIKAKIFMFLGGFLQRSNGGRNASFDEINSIIEQDHKRDMAKLHQREVFMNWAKEGVTDLGAKYKEEVAGLKFKQAALTQATADEAKAQLIRNGIPADEAENDVLVKKLRAEGDKVYATEYEKLLHDKATEAMAKAHLAISRGQLAVAQHNSQKADVPSESEGNNAARGRNMTLAIDNLEKEGLSKYVPPESSMQKWFSNQERIEAAAENNKSIPGQAINFALRKAGGIPQNELEGLPAKDAKYFSLMRQVVEPYARKQSGAAIARTEWNNFASQTGLGTGDFGKQLREQAARDMVTLGGRATKQLEESDKTRGASNGNGKTPTVVETRVIKGKTWHKLSNGQFVSQ